MNPPAKFNDAWTEEPVPYVEEDHGIPFRYKVESDSRPLEWNLVDLTDRGGLGSCSCEDFKIRANPNFTRHGKHIPYAPKRQGRTDCRHLAAAKEYFYQTVTVPMLAKMRDGIPSS
jgi:hypothetical protein